MNYRAIGNDGLPRILKTGAAVDNKAVFGDLKMARMAIWTAVDHEIRTLRAGRDAALGTRESELLTEESPESLGERIAALDIPPAPGEDDLRNIPAHLRRT